ncbi:MFS transporter [Ruegeria sp. 2205SS24-7]|uniref:MFS transporter n=1 Tax=Ruegeria discodermiae TaxID=3064389 RepID=UPI0027411EC1|nr:MFS transporter [Ruegeria sp. 2205SS24-7]MDP5215841.1 MFS transporter [Ruegeria sp. 2205SS24-7]
MLSVLRHRTYRNLFAAQVVALLGTGLATVALSLLAFDLAGEQAGVVLGTALTIKMLAYVGLAPVAAAFATQLDRRKMLIVLDLVRAGAALCLPFVDAIWQIYALIFVLQAASAGFTPAFQATIPDVLPEERDYTNALSLSRLAYDLENLASPTLAAALLVVVSFDTLFWGTTIGFLASALLIGALTLPSPKPSLRRGIWERTTRGIRLYLSLPRLRGLLALSLSAAMVSGMVLVNTVVLIRSTLGLGETMVPLTLGSFGAGSMAAALVLPRLLERRSDRAVMMGCTLLAVVTCLGLGSIAALTGLTPMILLSGWCLIGIGYSGVMTPVGRLLRRSAPPEDRPALFAAQFTLSHACWLLAYPLTGWLLARFGPAPSFLALGVICALSLLAARRLWPPNAAKD